MIEHAIHSLISGLCNGRVYYAQAPQDIEAPYIVFFKVAGPREHSHDGPSHLAHPRFQFSVFANTYLEVKQITQTIQSILDCYTGESEGVQIQSCLYINEVDMYEPMTGIYHAASGYTGLHHVASDYEIYHKED